MICAPAGRPMVSDCSNYFLCALCPFASLRESIFLMPMTPATPSSTAAPASAPASPRLRLPESSRIPILPPKPDYAAVAEAATRTETNLLRWLDYTPEPSLEQIDVSSKIIWRLAAVRKTLSLVGTKNKQLIGKVPKQLTQTMQEIDRLMAELAPPKPKPPKSTLKPLPPLPPLYPRAQREPALQAADLQPLASGLGSLASSAPRPIATCPELRNPMHTVQAAERQVGQLCQEAGVPMPLPEPKPAPAPAVSIPQTAPATAHPTPDPAYRSSKSYGSSRSFPTAPAEVQAYLDSVTDIREFLDFVEFLEKWHEAEVTASQSPSPKKRPPPT